MYAAILRALALACVLGSSMALSNADLGKVFGRRANPIWLAACTTQWDAVVRLADLSTPLRQAHFLAQVAHESQGCRVFEENLRYTTARRLMAVWPSRFKTVASTKGLVRNPSALANRVYANRMGNGNEASGDGWKNRGRGPLMLTGEDMYRIIGEMINMDLVANPDLVLDPEIGWLTAAAVWKMKDCNRWADRDDIVAVTRRINGGKIGIEDRRAYLAKAKPLMLALPLTAVKGEAP